MTGRSVLIVFLGTFILGSLVRENLPVLADWLCGLNGMAIAGLWLLEHVDPPRPDQSAEDYP